MAERFVLKDAPEMVGYEVSALQVTKTSVALITEWCGGVEVVEHDALKHDITFAAVNVPTTEGMKRASEGDWVVKYPSGNFYPMKDWPFQSRYEHAGG